MHPLLKRVFPILLLAMFASMLGIGIIVPLLPLYAENLGASGVGLGFVFGVFALTRALVMPYAGRLSDRRGRKLVLGIGLLAYTLTSVGYNWANNIASLSFMRAVQGVASGMIMPIAQAYVGDVSPKGEEGRWMGYLNAGLFGGFGVGPLMGGTISEHFGMSAAFNAMAGFNLLAFLLVVIFLPEVSHHHQVMAPSSSFREMFSSGMVKSLIVFNLNFAVGRGIFAAFLPIFAGIQVGLSPSQVGVLVAFNILLMSALQIYGGNIADRLDRKILVVVGSLLMLASLALVPLSHGFVPLLGVCALGAVGGGISMPAASALGIEEGRQYGMGVTVAALAMAFAFGMAAGPVLGGAIVDQLAIDIAFYFAAVLGLVGTGLFVWFVR